MRVLAALLLLFVSPAAVAGRPQIDRGGVVNAASLLPPGLPGGNLAPGALFLVRGRQLGPSAAASSNTPLDELAGVSVRILVAGGTWNAALLEAGDREIRALVPLDIALGPASVTVAYQGQQSLPVNTRVVDASPGLFTLSGDGGGPLRQQPVHRGDEVTLLATGIGAAGNKRIEVFVAGYEAKQVHTARDKECCGIDRITFAVPSSAPSGCHVPVQVRAGGQIPSNIGAIAVEPLPPSCPDLDFPRDVAGYSGRIGFAIPFRLSILLESESGDKRRFTGDALVAGFRAGSPGPGVERLLYLPPLGACTLYTAAGSLSEIDSYVQTALLAGTAPLDGGAFEVALPDGAGKTGASKTVPYVPLAGDYAYGQLGGSIPDSPIPDSPQGNEPLFLRPGIVSIATRGGADLAAFRLQAPFPEPVSWTNAEQAELIDRSRGLEVRWELDRAEQTVAIAGLSIDKPGHASAGFLCLAPGGDRRFRIPAPILQSLPASRTRRDDSLGYLMIGALPPGNDFLHSVAGLDYTLAVGLSLDGRSTRFR